MLRIGLSGLLVALVAVIISYWIYYPRPTPLAVLWVADYAAPLPPNALCQEDAELLRDAFSPRGFAAGLSTGKDGAWVQKGAANRKELDRQLDTLLASMGRPGGPGFDVVLFYVSAHGLLNDQGEPYLVLSGPGRPIASSSLQADELPSMKVSDLLDRIGKHYPGSKKVVFLDASRIARNWRLGIAPNGFNRALANVTLPANVYVINSCQEFESGLAYPEHGRSAFAYFVCRGLAGEADGNQDGRVMLQELADYLPRRVSQRAAAQRNQSQQPQLLGKAEDFAIASTSGGEISSAVQQLLARRVEIDPKMWAVADELWAEYEGLWSQNQGNPSGREILRRELPGEMVVRDARLREGLLRLEQLLLAGAAYRDQVATTQKEIEELLGKTTWPPRLGAAAPLSLPLALGRTDPADEELKKWSAFLAAPASDKPAEGSPEGSNEAAPPLAAPEAAWGVWKKVVENESDSQLDLLRSPKQAKELQRLARLARGTGEVELVELRMLRRLSVENTNLPAAVRDDFELLKSALTCRQHAELAAFAAGDERTLPVLRARIDKTDDTRRKAEDQLFFIQNEEQRNQLRTGPLPAARGEYDEAHQAADELRDMLRLRDALWADLPYLMEWSISARDLAGVANQDDKTLLAIVDDVLNLIEQARVLSQSLEQVLSGADGSQAEASEAWRRAQTARDEIRGGNQEPRYQATYRDIEEYCTSAAASERMQLLATMLQMPFLPAPTRKELHDKLVKTMQREASQAASSTSGSAKGLSPTAPRKQNDASAAAATNLLSRWLAAREKLFALTPSTLAAPESESSTPAAEAMKLSPKELGARSAAIVPSLDATLKQLQPEEELKLASEVRGPLSLADLRLRIDAPWLWASVSDAELENACYRLRHFDRHSYYVWQAERTLADFWGPELSDQDVAMAGSYFEQAARKFLDAAKAEWVWTSPPASAAYEPAARRLAEYAETSRILARKFSGSDARLTRLEPGGEKGAYRAALPDWKLSGPASPGDFALAVADLEQKLLPFQPLSPEGSPLAPQPDTYASRPLPKVEERLLPGFAAFEPSLFEQDSAFTSLKELHVRFYYRGHPGTLVLPVQKLIAGPELVWKAPTDKSATVFVQSQGEGGRVAIVLDCSASMYKPLGEELRVPRYLEAIKALRSLTDELGKSGQFDMSVWLFAHRRGFESYTWENPFKGYRESERNRIFLGWNTKISQLAPAARLGITFTNDFEKVWPRKGFSKASDADLARILGKDSPIYPMGYTPLYAALKHVIENDLANEQSPRRLIVLTDGGDGVPVMGEEELKKGYEYIPPWDGNHVGGEAPTAAQEAENNAKRKIRARSLVDALARYSTASNFIGLYVVDCSGEKNPVIREEVFGKDLWKHGGVYEVSRPDTLERRLKESAGLFEYKVIEKKSGTEVDRKSTSDVSLIVIPSPGRYDVVLDVLDARPLPSAPIEINGGERLWLDVRQTTSGVQLVHRRLDKGEVDRREDVPNPDAKADEPDFSPRALYVSALYTEKRAGDSSVEFRVSVQNQDAERFSPRPAQIWAEIAPCKGALGSLEPLPGPPILITDAEFQINDDDARVPILKFAIPDWPLDANAAQIRLWFRLEDKGLPPGRETVVVNDHLGKQAFSAPDNDPEGVTLRLLEGTDPGKKYNVLKVIEQHPPAAAGAGPNWRRIQVVGAEPDQIRRRYFPNNRRVEHEFFFTADYRDRSLTVQPLGAWKETAATFEKPLEVRIAPK